MAAPVVKIFLTKGCGAAPDGKNRVKIGLDAAPEGKNRVTMGCGAAHVFCAPCVLLSRYAAETLSLRSENLLTEFIGNTLV